MPDESSFDDWRGLGDLISLAVQRVSEPVEGMHHAIADRTFAFGGRRAAPVGDAYRMITSVAYGTVRGVGAAPAIPGGDRPDDGERSRRRAPPSANGRPGRGLVGR